MHKTNFKHTQTTISKTNLKKNNAYTYTFDFGFVNSLSGSNVKFSITGRCK